MTGMQAQVRGIRGRFSVFNMRPGVMPRYVPNTIMDSWAFIAAQAFGFGNTLYRISSMYIEFENVAAPADPVDIPTFLSSDGVDYYSNLISNPVRDFLRVPLLSQPALSIMAGSTGVISPWFVTGVTGNTLNFFAQSIGAYGVTGKVFSDTVNSKVFGAALVATPVFADYTQDVILARSYLPLDEQVSKEPSSQIGSSWQVILG